MAGGGISTLDELFALDPLKLTLRREEANAAGLPDPLLERIEKFRKARAQFMERERKQRKPKGPKVDPRQIDLEDAINKADG